MYVSQLTERMRLRVTSVNESASCRSSSGHWDLDAMVVNVSVGLRKQTSDVERSDGQYLNTSAGYYNGAERLGAGHMMRHHDEVLWSTRVWWSK